MRYSIALPFLTNTLPLSASLERTITRLYSENVEALLCTEATDGWIELILKGSPRSPLGPCKPVGPIGPIGPLSP